MIIENFTSSRNKKHLDLVCDLVVTGGGLAGVCAAIASARQGLKVVLIQDRPVLGGNSSSEVRLWALGATSHMGNNNRWAREGGIIDEILVENTFRNKEGNPVIFDTVLMDKVLSEKNIQLLLNTIALDVEKSADKKIAAIHAYNPQNETEYTISGTYFCDASGDGLVAYLAGAAYRSGAEDKEEFNEKFVQDKDDYGEKLGHSIFFYTKDSGKPVQFVRPEFAYTKEFVQENIHRIKNPNYFNPQAMGCKYWWIEYGGRLDTIHDTEEIKYTLWKLVYGIWDYIKNSGQYPDVENLTLEWVGLIPGKRESRRFVGPYMLNQHDVIEQRTHYDAVTYGGWSIDLHPADGVFSEKSACNQWHSKGVFQIPYRCYVTEDIDNLFLAGRIISSSHIAYGATRVMLTSAVGGEVVGTAAAVCMRKGLKPIDLCSEESIVYLQQELIKNGNYIPQLEISHLNNLLRQAKLTTSSELRLTSIPASDELWKRLSQSAAQMLPVNKGAFPKLVVKVKGLEETDLTVGLRVSSKLFNHTPDTLLQTKTINIKKGIQEVEVDFNVEIEAACYAFVCFMGNEKVELLYSDYLITGLVSVFNKVVPAVSNWGKQVPPENSGIEGFEFWCPERRPEGQNIAMSILPAVEGFGKENLLTDVYRPVERTNAWVAAIDDKNPEIVVEWEAPVEIRTIVLFADTDYDHAMETVQWGHSDNRMPLCVDEIEIYADTGKLIASRKDNHQTKIEFNFPEAFRSSKLRIKLRNSSEHVPVSLFGIRIN